MCMCGKCSKLGGVVLAIVGILFLLKDMNVWNFWGLNWYTVAFLLMGLMLMGSGMCSECQRECCSSSKPKKR